METSIQHVFKATRVKSASRESYFKKFIRWAEGQEENRFGWTAFAIAGHGCVFTILTVVAILYTGNNFIFWPFAIAAMATSLVSNLAAMPTKITIPILFASVLADLVIIVLCLSHGIDTSASYR